MSILRVNRYKTKHCVLHNGMITWNSLPDIFKVNVSLSMFKRFLSGTRFLSGKILMLGATMIDFFLLKFMQLRFFKCNCFWFQVFCCEVCNYLFSGCNQDNQKCYYQLDEFLVSETIIVRLFQRNQYCYCDYFIIIVFNQVRFRLRLGCPGSLMSLYRPTFMLLLSIYVLYSNVTYHVMYHVM